MSKIASVFRIIDKVTSSVGIFASLIIPLIGGLIIYEVTMRYVFNRPTIWVHDVSQFLFGATYMLGGAYVLMLGKHVSMDMLYARFSVRGKALADILTGVLVIVFLVFLVGQSAVMAWESTIFRETFAQSAFDPPLYPIKIVFFIGCVLFLLQGIVKFIRDIQIFISNPESAAKPNQ